MIFKHRDLAIFLNAVNYILNRIKRAKRVENSQEKCFSIGQTVLPDRPDRSVLIRQKIVKNAKIQMRHFEQFSSNVQKSF